MPSVGSSRIQHLGPEPSARPMASCCCWRQDRSPRPRPFFHSIETTGNKAGRSARDLPRSIGRAPSGRFSDSHQRSKKRKDFPALGTITRGHFAARGSRWTCRVMVGAVKQVSAHRAPQQASDALEQRGLADAVAGRSRQRRLPSFNADFQIPEMSL